MARTAAAFTGGMRLSDHLGVSVIARVYPREAVHAALRSLGRDSRRRRDLPAEVMVYHVIVMAQFRTVSAREVLRCLVDGLRWISPDISMRVSGKSSISRARTRLGASRGGAAFPQARVTAMVELGTHADLAWHAGPLAESEAEQAERLLGHLSPGMLVLADRQYAGFPL